MCIRDSICEESGAGDTEPDFLAFHIAASLERACRLIDAELVEVRVAGRLGGINDNKTRGEQYQHCAKQTPALPLVADHAAKSVSESGADQENQQHLEKIGERRRILELSLIHICPHLKVAVHLCHGSRSVTEQIMAEIDMRKSRDEVQLHAQEDLLSLIHI